MNMPGININIDKINNNRFLSLLLAVLHHGLGNLADNSVPARSTTIVGTAMEFEDHLDDVPTDERRIARRSRT